MTTREEKIKRIKEWIHNTPISKLVVGETIRYPTDKMDEYIYQHASAKLIKIAKGEEEEDDRDNLKYSNVYGIEDLIAENIEKDKQGLFRKAYYKLQKTKSLDWLKPSFFSKAAQSIINTSLANVVEGINPIEYIEANSRITKLGEGGISNIEAVPDISRQINPSTFGFFDPLHISESEKIGVTQYITLGTGKGRDNKFYKLVRNAKTGKLEWVDHETLLNKTIQIKHPD